MTRAVEIPYSAEWLNDRLSYDPITGLMRWKIRPREDFASDREWNRWDTQFIGKLAGSLNSLGYQQIGIDNVRYLLHRIIWKMMYGNIPKKLHVDHMNGNKTDNRIVNLQLATNAQNGQKRNGLGANNTSGIRGVDFYIARQKWRVQISVNGKYIYCGCYDTQEEAKKVAIQKREEIFGERWKGTDEKDMTPCQECPHEISYGCKRELHPCQDLLAYYDAKGPNEYWRALRRIKRKLIRARREIIACNGISVT